MKLHLFFRKPAPGFFSIEELFSQLIPRLPAELHHKSVYMPCRSSGLFARIINLFYAFTRQGEINHITGDIHYVSILLHKKRTILTIHDLEIIHRSGPVKRSLILFFWYWLPARRVKRITVISEFTRHELLQKISIPESKIRVIPDCISNSISYSPKPFNSRHPVLLQVGTKANKNLPRLIRALGDFRCTLIILGELSPLQKKLLHQHGIEYENYFNMPYSFVLETYRRCDALCFVSTYEGFGMPILEAQATGRPVITSTCASMPSVAGEGALLADPFSVESIRAALHRLCDEPGLPEQLVQKGLANVQRFSPQSVADQYLRLYQEIAENNSSL
ncbi:MAG: glycosyltransferase family 1 protein [Bacteroidales bacterium]